MALRPGVGHNNLDVRWGRPGTLAQQAFEAGFGSAFVGDIHRRVFVCWSFGVCPSAHAIGIPFFGRHGQLSVDREVRSDIVAVVRRFLPWVEGAIMPADGLSRRIRRVSGGTPLP